MQKYVTVSVSHVITQIAEKTDIQGYTKGIIEIFFPDDDELGKWNEKQQQEWVIRNNKRMKAICKFLNDNNF